MQRDARLAHDPDGITTGDLVAVTVNRMVEPIQQSRSGDPVLKRRFQEHRLLHFERDRMSVRIIRHRTQGRQNIVFGAELLVSTHCNQSIVSEIPDSCRVETITEMNVDIGRFHLLHRDSDELDLLERSDGRDIKVRKTD